jgi:hypothetical protein
VAGGCVRPGMRTHRTCRMFDMSLKSSATALRGTITGVTLLRYETNGR